jgi:predicted ester cyclase
MAFDVDRLLRLWTEPLPAGAAAEEAFRAVYTDPVTVNGAALTAADLVARARALQAAFADAQREVVSVVEDGDRVAVAFRMGGRQVGPLGTSAGPLPPTGRHVELRVIDVLTLTGGRISEIWMVADELGALAAVGAVALVPAS